MSCDNKQIHWLVKIFGKDNNRRAKSEENSIKFPNWTQFMRDKYRTTLKRGVKYAILEKVSQCNDTLISITMAFKRDMEWRCNWRYRCSQVKKKKKKKLRRWINHAFTAIGPLNLTATKKRLKRGAWKWKMWPIEYSKAMAIYYLLTYPWLHTSSVCGTLLVFDDDYDANINDQ